MAAQMAGQSKNPTGGGIFIVIGIVAGIAIGRVYDQTSIGLIAGVAAGLGIAGWLWWRERRS